jgi:hypothetical protein
MGTRSAAGTTAVRLDGTYLDTRDVTNATQKLNPSKLQTWTNGNGQNQFNRYFDQKVTLAVSTPQSWDLYGSLSDVFGNTLNLVKVKFLWIEHLGSTAGETLTIDGTFIERVILSGTTPTYKLGPGGVWFTQDPIDGWAVTNTTDDVITLDPGAKDFDVRIIIGGTE